MLCGTQNIFEFMIIRSFYELSMSLKAGTSIKYDSSNLKSRHATFVSIFLGVQTSIQIQWLDK